MLDTIKNDDYCDGRRAMPTDLHSPAGAIRRKVRHRTIRCEDTRLHTPIKLASPTIPVYSASGKRVMMGAKTFRILKENHRFARIIERKRDKAVTRAYLAALPDEIGKRITAAPTVVKVLPTTWTHADSLRAGL